MKDADVLLRSGDLDGARGVLVEAARRNPGDVDTRMFLFQLLALAREWDKAQTQLSTLAQLSPEAQMLSVVYNQAIAAEREREAVFDGTLRAPIHGLSAWAGGVSEALQLAAQGCADMAEATRGMAFDAAPDTPGMINGKRFDWIADADPTFGPTIEAIIGGRYGLLPFDVVAEISSEGPHDLRDIVWYPVEITMKTGPRVAALLPARYPGASDDSAEKLSRATSWRDDGTGRGQHLWMLSDDTECELLSVRSLKFD